VIHISKNTYISEDEFVFKASRSSGPGGQNVNKLNTRITLFFDVSNSPNLSEWQKQRVLSRLATRADKNGVLRIVSQKFRTQKANRKAALERLQRLLQEALKTRPARKKTNVPPYAREQRLQEKKHRSLLKQHRTRKNWTEEIGP
jgi:ribosome-associated protein